MMALLAVPITAGLLLEIIGLLFHARDMQRAGGEGGASHYRQRTTFARLYVARNFALGMGVVVIPLLALAAPDGMAGLLAWGGAAVILVLTALVGRALFYVLVIPTTMPGSFFWRNPGFQEHARHTGLADMTRAGVVRTGH
jgi:hypothetical protein